MSDTNITSTTLLYLADSYLKTATAKVVNVQSDGKTKPDGSQSANIVVDQTIFYAQGGGQLSDQGTIQGPNGSLGVTHVSYNGGEVLHKGSLRGNIKIGDTVSLQIDWEQRHQNMQWHTAGHIIDQAVKNIVHDANSIDGNHGIGKKLNIIYTTRIPSDKKASIQVEVDKIISQKMIISTEMVTKDEILKRKIRVPFDLPSNKPLRLLLIGNFPPIPDGGTHLHNTEECLQIIVTEIRNEGDKSIVSYSVGEEIKYVEPVKIRYNHSQKAAKVTALCISLSALRNQAENIRAELSMDQSSPAELMTKYLGKKGLFNELAQVIRGVAAEDRKGAGQVLNELKLALESQIAKLSMEQDIDVGWTDMTVPGLKPKTGHVHPVSQAMEEVTRIFERIGFTRARYPEVDWDHYVFEALNMPPNHPARDEWETFFVDAPIDHKFGKIVLTTHTSNGQVREMERLDSKPPIRMINIGRCYRRQQDATHTQMFHQFEGLVVDRGINIQHLKGTLDYFAQEFYGPGTKSRIRPFHFQFTEPSFEVDFSCHICDGTGLVDGKDESGKATKIKCKFCKSGWHEVGGAGMVHPNVLKAGGIDPEEYTGFAFGWGVERTYTLKPGLNIDDIRLFYSGEMRFLEQF